LPLQPVTRTIQLPLETLADADALFQVGLNLVQHSSPSYRTNASRDLEDYFFYLGAVYPSYVRHLHRQLVDLSDERLEMFSFRFSTWLYLLDGADDSYVDYLTTAVNQQPANWLRWSMLAAIGTPVALSNLAELARRHNYTSELENLGFEIPGDGGAAIRRFTLWRRAIKKVDLQGSRADLISARHPIGLPLNTVTISQEIKWHYLTLDLTKIEGLPSIPVQRLHLVSPPKSNGWTLFAQFLSDSRYEFHSVDVDEYYIDDETDEFDALLNDQDNDKWEDLGYVELLPYDDKLTYCNAHTMCTHGVDGILGGPPRGLYPNPKCPCCQRLMFHLATVESVIREYGDDGWRILFLCEDCQMAACQATAWN
jgi:hypothetical protein